jgi:hypothetical protein
VQPDSILCPSGTASLASDQRITTLQNCGFSSPVPDKDREPGPILKNFTFGLQGEQASDESAT